ncbi:uncharacterized protein VTP21DRAFT_1165 [Calcarisporiella thermophila]|uniref:uncharacterized protein n=1 Tax=Calcarisporiella thermophila TaxID=911321 RepID=UPI003744421F
MMPHTMLMYVLLLCFAAVANAATVAKNLSPDQPYRGVVYASLKDPRGITTDSTDDLLVVSRGNNEIVALYSQDDSQDGVAQSVTVIGTSNLPSGAKLTHGIAYSNGYIYASSQTTVWRWAYKAGQRSATTSAAEVVVNSMESGGHSTRTLHVDENRQVLFVSVGSAKNIDKPKNPYRAQIRVFPLNSTLPQGGYDYRQGQIWGDGLRNEVGLARDLEGKLWGIENGSDELARPDLGGDIHNDNPAEELNSLEDPGAFYGYPYCWSEYDLTRFNTGKGKSTQWAWPEFMEDGIHTDSWCQNTTNNRLPALSMQAHVAPLDIVFYRGEGCDGARAFSCSLKGDAFVTFHGSWNRNPPAGYKVVRIPFKDGKPTGEVLDVWGESNPEECNSSAKCVRPVSAVFNRKGHLFVTSDDSNEVWRIVVDASLPDPSVRSGKAASSGQARTCATAAVGVLSGLVLAAIEML